MTREWEQVEATNLRRSDPRTVLRLQARQFIADNPAATIGDVAVELGIRPSEAGALLKHRITA